MTETITLDGRKFVGISQALTANQDDYIRAHLRLAGAIDLLQSPLDGKERAAERRAADLVTHLLLSGRKTYVLAGCLTERGKVWSRAEADANAARFAGISDAEAKAAMNTAILGFVLGLFSATPAVPSGTGHSGDALFRLGRRIGRAVRGSLEGAAVGDRQPQSWRIN